MRLTFYRGHSADAHGLKFHIIISPVFHMLIVDTARPETEDMVFVITVPLFVYSPSGSGVYIVSVV